MANKMAACQRSAAGWQSDHETQLLDAPNLKQSEDESLFKSRIRPCDPPKKFKRCRLWQFFATEFFQSLWSDQFYMHTQAYIVIYLPASFRISIHSFVQKSGSRQTHNLKFDQMSDGAWLRLAHKRL